MLSRTLSLIQRQFEAQYNVTTTIRHKGEKGRQREHGLATLLREHLPLAYGVATGEIVPYLGDEHSPQCDIIIYDQLHYPILGKNDAVQLVPLEAVYCVIEAKSTITKTELVDAEAKFARIRAMPRCKAKSKLKKGTQREPLLMVFGHTLGTSTDTVSDRLSNFPWYSVFALDTGTAIVLDGDNGQPSRVIFMKTTDRDKDKYQSLAWFYFFLLHGMQSIDLGVPDFYQIIKPD